MVMGRWKDGESWECGAAKSSRVGTEVRRARWSVNDPSKSGMSSVQVLTCRCRIKCDIVFDAFASMGNN